MWDQDDASFEDNYSEESIKTDKDNYPILPNGQLQLQFVKSSSRPNLCSHYTEWAMASLNSKHYKIENDLVVKYLTKVNIFYLMRTLDSQTKFIYKLF